MRVEIPFIYKAEVYTARHERVERTYRETLPVEIEELSGADAPVALAWRGRRSAALDDHVVPAELRSHGGRLYEPLRHAVWGDGRAERMGIDGADRLVKTLAGEGVGRYGLSLALGTYFDQPCIKDSGEVKLKGPPKASSVIESKRDEAIKRVREDAARLILVDGGVHRRTPEPVLMASPSHPGKVLIIDDFEFKDTRHMFRLDQAREAAERAAFLGGKAVAEVELPAFALLRPQDLRRDLARDTAFSTLNSLDATVARQLHHMPIPAIEAFYDLREEMGNGYTTEGRDLPRLHALGLALCDVVANEFEGGLAMVRAHRYDLARVAVPLGLHMAREDDEALYALAP